MTTQKLLGAALMLLIAAVAATQQSVSAQTPNGTWVLYPAQSSVYATAVQQPINADGSSNFKSNGKGVVPVKFSLSAAPGPVTFQSILSDGTDPNEATTNDYSFLSFTPATPLLFNQITHLSAVYSFNQGNCHGGSLRWSVRVSPTQSVFIYYGDYPSFTDCTTGANYQTGQNLISLSDLRYDTSQVGGTFYDNLAGALALVGNWPIIRASLVLDSGWGGDQVLTLTSATVNTNTFVPAGGSGVQTCELPPATIQITKTSGSPSGLVNDLLTIQPNDDDSHFRIVDCKYMYNLATSQLSGTGTYKVEVMINGNPATGAAYFDLK